MIHKSRSYWFASAESYCPSEPLRSSTHADVCIIGGGVTGLSAAYHLRKADSHASVALLESEVVGFGASGRNAGQLIVAFGERNSRAQLKRFGAQKLGEAYAYVHKGIQAIEELISENGIDCDYAPTGTLFMGLQCDGNRRVDEYWSFHESLNQKNFLETVSERDVAQEFSSPYFGSAVFDRRGGQINPLKLVRGMKAAAQLLGAEIYEHSPVVRIERTPQCITVRTGAGTVRCKKLILATNAYSHLLHGLEGLALDRNQSPVFVHANVTAPLSGAQWRQLNWPRRCGVNLLSDLFYSFAPTADGRLLYVGGYYVNIPKGDEMSCDVSFKFLTTGPKHLVSFFPALDGVPTFQSWGGPISATRDYIPHVGVLGDDRISYANGCWGHGVPLSTQNGHTLADLALDRITERTKSWLVTRSKANWPSRSLTPWIVECTASIMRYNVRRTARRLDAQLKFTD